MVRPEVYYLITLSNLKENRGLPFSECLLSTLGWICCISFSSYNNPAAWTKLHFQRWRDEVPSHKHSYNWTHFSWMTNAVKVELKQVHWIAPKSSCAGWGWKHMPPPPNTVAIKITLSPLNFFFKFSFQFLLLEI